MSEPLLKLEGVHAGYGRVGVLRGVDVALAAGEVVALLGANGAGKSTLLKTAAGLVTPTAGVVAFEGIGIGSRRPEWRVRNGIALVPEGRLLFGSMTVAENLELGAYLTPRAGRGAAIAIRRTRVLELFPVLADRASQAAETLSGGEQQMLAIGRALMSGPRVLLLDEPSLGLAPMVIAQIFSAIDLLRGDGVSVLLAEQDARLALKHADRGYVMRTGSVALSGTSAELLADDSVRMIYLGSMSEEGTAR
ncbi:MAG: ABC transporter ATP-binding protein [Coriobacteriia bacterium]|nr:ABC transporter ATP-binding protein [Coriobacteriia bacterium]